ncbi:MAG: flippase-like domain-containing protein [Actinomycetota bacterium]
MNPSARRPDPEILDEIKSEPSGSGVIVTYLRRGFILAIGVMLLVLMQQELGNIISSADDLASISFGWFAIMVGFEVISFICMWALIKQMLPKLSWFVAATSQLVSNSVSRVVPGGAAVGGATLYRMLAVSGTPAPQAASAMAATSIVSNALLFAIPAVAGLLALLGAPVPDRLVPSTIAGGVFFAVLGVLGVIAMGFKSPIWWLGRAIRRVVAWLGRPFGRAWRFDPRRLVEERERLVEVLGDRWPKAVAAAAGNWAFDYLALVAALYAVGAEPRLSLVLLAFAAGAVLAMVPFTPGGVGFVEVGLVTTLVITGISTRDAALATLAYRIVSLLFPVLVGPIAWLIFRRRYPHPQHVDPAGAG